MLEDVLPNIPRLYTALAEWAACLVYVLMAKRRLSRSNILLFLIALPVMIGIQLLAGELPSWAWTLGMAFAAAAMLGLIYLTGEVAWPVAIYLAARAFVLAEFAASLEWQIRTFFAGPEGLGVVVDLALLVVSYCAIFAGAWWLERNHFNDEFALRIDMRNALSATAIALVTFLMSNISFLTTNSPFSGRFALEVYYIRTLVDLAGYVALFAQQGQRMELERAVEVQAMNALVRSQHEQYLQARRNMDIVNAKFHDLKHYIAAIRAELDPQSRAEVLNQLEDSISDYGRQVETGNPVLDAVLTIRAQRCADENIEFTYVVDGEAVDFMDAMSLSALMGNAIDNAIEASAKIAAGDRRLIKVAIHQHNSLAVLVFENYFETPITFEEDLPVTSKRDRQDHGYGTRNMRQIAEQYGGSLTIETEANWFTVRALIPRPTGEAE